MSYRGCINLNIDLRFFDKLFESVNRIKSSFARDTVRPSFLILFEIFKISSPEHSQHKFVPLLVKIFKSKQIQLCFVIMISVYVSKHHIIHLSARLDICTKVFGSQIAKVYCNTSNNLINESPQLTFDCFLPKV